MHTKNIKRIVLKQLKTRLPGWKKMSRKSKKELTREIMAEIVNDYDYSQALDIPIEELIGIENQKPSGGNRSLPEMAAYIENVHSGNLFDLDSLIRYVHISAVFCSREVEQHLQLSHREYTGSLQTTLFHTALPFRPERLKFFT